MMMGSFPNVGPCVQAVEDSSEAPDMHQVEVLLLEALTYAAPGQHALPGTVTPGIQQMCDLTALGEQ